MHICVHIYKSELDFSCLSESLSILMFTDDFIFKNPFSAKCSETATMASSGASAIWKETDQPNEMLFCLEHSKTNEYFSSLEID